ncbi:response regulator [Edaphobacter sp. HDX4]|uniref:response regulator n=1 Tax=Edaphobacter sp. HDX4 TaxID=2794064 RepID=UPI002FE52DB4
MGPELKSRRVLIVDDERTIADTLAKIFMNAGYEVCAAYTAEQACAMLPTWSPNLAIIDVHLPHMNGIDFAILLKAEYPNCRLMLFSGQTETAELLEMALREGHTFEILAKPVHPTELLNWAAMNAQIDKQNREPSGYSSAESGAPEMLPLRLTTPPSEQ